MLEDLHWVDKISEEFLGFLAENIRDARVLLLATYRPGYRPPWIDKSYAGQTPLQPLSQDDSIQMVRSVLRAEHLIDLVTQEIVAKADGNPFFLEQLALHAGEARDLRSDLMVPNTIHDVVMARIDRLPDETKRLLQTAAVIGREFPLRLLNAVWQGLGSVEDQLRELSRLEFVYERVETEGSVYVFRHALTQETAYGSLLERHRRVYHGAVGHALEELYSGRADEVAELLALHFGRSNEAEKSVDYAILAGEKSQRRWANSEALTYFNDALHRLDLLPDTEANRLRRIDAVIKQAEVKFALGQHAEHIQALDQIARPRRPDRRPAPPRHLALLARLLAHILTGGQPDIAIDHCNKAAAIAAAAGLDEIKAYAESCLAQVYLIAGRFAKRSNSGERALATFEAMGNLWWAAGRSLTKSGGNRARRVGRELSYCRRDPRARRTFSMMSASRSSAFGAWVRHTFIKAISNAGVQCCNEALALGPLPFDAAMAKGTTRLRRNQGRPARRRHCGSLDEPSLGSRVLGFAIRTRTMRCGSPRASSPRRSRIAARPLIESVLETEPENRLSPLRRSGVLVDGRVPSARKPCLRRTLRRDRDRDPGAHRRAQRSRAGDGDTSGIASSRRRCRRRRTCSTRPMRFSMHSAHSMNRPGSKLRAPRSTAGRRSAFSGQGDHDSDPEFGLKSGRDRLRHATGKTLEASKRP